MKARRSLQLPIAAAVFFLARCTADLGSGEQVGDAPAAPAEIADGADAAALDDATPVFDGESPDTAETNGPSAVELVTIPAGTFWMGCNESLDQGCQLDEKPQHLVTLSSFQIAKYETTVGDYKKCVAAGACTVPKCESGSAVACTWSQDQSSLPVTIAHLSEANDFCAFAIQGGRLPTEAEWEMAARGSCAENLGDCKASMRSFPWGNQLPDCEFAVMADPTYDTWGCGTAGYWPVGSKPKGASPFGLLDMAGNVSEATSDFYDPSFYGVSPKADPKNPWHPDNKGSGPGGPGVVRGGESGQGFHADGTSYLRASARSFIAGEGFRCARSVGP